MGSRQTYDNGRQDAWIEAIRDNCRTQVAGLHTRLNRLESRIVRLSGKVNHIYGGSAMLAAVVAVVVSIVGGIVVPLIVAWLNGRGGH